MMSSTGWRGSTSGWSTRRALRRKRSLSEPTSSRCRGFRRDSPRRPPLQVPRYARPDAPHLDDDGIIRVLQEQGHVPPGNLTGGDDVERIKLRIRLARNWVERYAPENVRFSILEKPPEIQLKSEVREAMLEVAEWLESHERFTVDELNNAIYDAAKKRGIPSKEWFRALYNVFIGKDRGPRLAPFLASLDREFVVRRLRLNG